MKLKIVVIFCICLMIFSTTCNATDNNISYYNGKLLVNNNKENNTGVLVRCNGTILIPLRAVLESIGSNVYWDENTGDIYFDYNGENYICQIVIPNSSFPENKYFTASKIKYKDSIYSDEHLPMGPMYENECFTDDLGKYKIIDGVMYLEQETGEYLLKDLGCNIEIDSNTCEIEITSDYRKNIVLGVKENELLISIREALENIGSIVNWDKNTGNIYFTYNNIQYICQFEQYEPNLNNEKYIAICQEKYLYYDDKYYVKLSDFGKEGEYYIVNDKTYLTEKTSTNLFESLGVKIEFDEKNCIINISNN